MTGRGKHERCLRLVVRRTRLTDRAHRRLWPDWRHHAFITDLDPPVVEMDEYHRDHATVELAIRELEEGAGMEHCPSGKFFANAAWLGCAVLAHNLTRWTARLGSTHPDFQLTVTRTIRSRFLSLPGRMVNRSGNPCSAFPSDGHGQQRSTPRSTGVARCRCSSENGHADRRGRTRPPRADTPTTRTPAWTRTPTGKAPCQPGQLPSTDPDRWIED